MTLLLFEYNNAKNALNVAKHKVSFEEAEAVWGDPDLVILHARKRGRNG